MGACPPGHRRRGRVRITRSPWGSLNCRVGTWNDRVPRAGRPQERCAFPRIFPRRRDRTARPASCDRRVEPSHREPPGCAPVASDRRPITCNRRRLCYRRGASRLSLPGRPNNPRCADRRDGFMLAARRRINRVDRPASRPPNSPRRANRRQYYATPFRDARGNCGGASGRQIQSAPSPANDAQR